MSLDQKGNLIRPPVQSYPAGLLGFLGIKNGGANPETMSQDLVPVIDLFQFYAQGQKQTLGPDVLTFPVGPSTQRSTIYIAPARKSWYVLNVSAFSGTVGATAFGSAYIFVTDSVSLVVKSIYPATARAVVGEQFVIAAGGFWMDPGDQLGIATFGPAASTGFAMTMYAYYAELQR